jgi:hypothetical protein
MAVHKWQKNRREKVISLSLFCSITDTCMRTSLKYPKKTYPSNTVALYIKFPTHEFRRQIQNSNVWLIPSYILFPPVSYFLVRVWELKMLYFIFCTLRTSVERRYSFSGALIIITPSVNFSLAGLHLVWGQYLCYWADHCFSSAWMSKLAKMSQTRLLSYQFYPSFQGSAGRRRWIIHVLRS